jgi:uncharacterized alpha-E superfamily protein
MMLSRVADSLYWMSRYLGAEHIARLMSVQYSALLDHEPQDNDPSWARVLASLRATPPGTGEKTYRVSRSLAYRIIGSLTFDRRQAPSIANALYSARENARQVCEQTSTEMWEQLNRLYLALRSTSLETVWHTQSTDFYVDLINGLHQFHGITDSTMSNGEGWHFIQLGRYMERAQLVSSLLAFHFGGIPGTKTGPADTPFEWYNLLKMCTAFEAYCKVYTADIQPSRVAEFLVFYSEFPRSIRFAVDMVQAELQKVAPEGNFHRNGRAERIAGRLRAYLDYGQVEEIMNDSIQVQFADIQRQCAEIHDAVFETYISYPVDAHIA